MTRAVARMVVTASAEQMPSTWSVTGLGTRIGSMSGRVSWSSSPPRLRRRCQIGAEPVGTEPEAQQAGHTGAGAGRARDAVDLVHARALALDHFQPNDAAGVGHLLALQRACQSASSMRAPMPGVSSCS